MTIRFSKLSRSIPVVIVGSMALGLLLEACSSDNKAAGNTDAGSGGQTAAGGSSGAVGGGGKPATGGGGGAATGGGGTATGGGGGTAAGGGGAGGVGGDGGSCVPEDLTVPTVDTTITPDAGATLIHHYHAVGVQNYTCIETKVGGDGGPDSGTPEFDWGGPTHASTPNAILSDNCGTAAVHHTGGPTWTSIEDGSFVTGKKKAAVPKTDTIPWLLLTGTGNDEADGAVGLLSKVTFIQRLDTVGGAPPSDPCDDAHVGAKKDVDYTADYYFYTGP